MIMRIRRSSKWLQGVLPAAALTLAAAATFAAPSDWTQWGRTPQHDGASPVLGQPLEAILADILYDPFVEQMKLEQGSLFAHYAVPLVDETGLYMTFKSGTYIGVGYFDLITWSVRRLGWNNGVLETAWSFASDWKPEDLNLARWEAVFLPVISGDHIYVPGLGGTVSKVSKATGIEEARINPFDDLDPGRYVAGGLAAAPDGSIVYNVLGLDPAEDSRYSPTQAWLVRVDRAGVASRADWSTLVPGAPGAEDLCRTAFSQDQKPWPPSPDAVPPSLPCGAQRPGINVVPAIAPDGTIYTVSRAHQNSRYSYLVAVHPNLTPAWSASLRGILNDGCGVLLPRDDSPIGCRSNAPFGVEPATNDRPAGSVSDAGTSSPVVLPDGAILLGTSSSYNFGRGHLFKFNSTGEALATYDFGWDITPAVFVHDGTYSIVIKDNQYFDLDGDAYYDVSSLDANLVPEWSYRATNTESCARQPTGPIVCVDDHPYGFEWCVNQPAIDAAGTAYLNGEDGILYAFNRAGEVVGQIFLDTALGAAYTPLSIGPDGILYTQNNGRLFAVGKARTPRQEPDPAPASPRATRVVERP